MKPLKSDRTLTPTSIALVSLKSTAEGTAMAGSHRLHGHCGFWIVTVTPAAGVSIFPLSSTARLLMVTLPRRVGVHANVHDSRPIAGCHVAPPSTDTSTPATMPP